MDWGVRIILPIRILALRLRTNVDKIRHADALKSLELTQIIKYKSLRCIELKVTGHLVEVPPGVTAAVEWFRVGCEGKGRSGA
jgi:hypothetical protein